MATPYSRNSVSLTSSRDDHRQDQVRLRALYQRANALYGKLSRLSFISPTTFRDIEQAFLTICREFQEQRNQSTKQSTPQLPIESSPSRKPFRSTPNSLRQASTIEIHDIDPLVVDIEDVLNKVVQKLQQPRFKSSRALVPNKAPSANRDPPGKVSKKPPAGSLTNRQYASPNVWIQRLYAIDLDICAKWIVASLDGRIFLCNGDGDIRIFSYSLRFRRQPLLTERFYLSITRLVSAFTVTQDYLIAYEGDTQMITLHTHHGALLMRSSFPYEPNMIVRCDYVTKNKFWSCSRMKRQCVQWQVNHSNKEVQFVREFDYKQPVADAVIDPVDVSSDEHERIAIHDVNMVTMDRLLVYSNDQCAVVPLDFIKYTDGEGLSRIERVLLVPTQPNLIVVVRAPQSTTLQEILVVDMALKPPKVLACLTELSEMQNIDVTSNGEIVYAVKPPLNRRIVSKMYIYSLIN